MTPRRSPGRSKQRKAPPQLRTLVDLEAAAPTGVRGPECGVEIPGSAGEDVLVVLVHLECKECRLVLEGAESLTRLGKVRVFVGVVPKDKSDRSAATQSTMGLLWGVGPKREKALYEKGISTLDPLTETPEITLGDVETIKEEAREILGGAERVVGQHADRVPAIFFNSRLYTAPLEHLAWLLENHPESIAATRVEGTS